MKPIVFGEIGSVSRGTHKNSDLLESFAWELRKMMRRNKGRLGLFLMQKRTLLARMNDAREWHDVDENPDAAQLVEAAIDALNDLSAPYCYFGTREANGSDFGWWVSNEGIDDGISMDDIRVIPAGSPIPTEYGMYMQVNDHGNRTLWIRYGNHKVRELWSVV